MADFEQVLSRAIAGLPQNTSELRRALYDRARTSLVSQLKSMNPPLPQTEIAKQRLALEHAIRKVESNSALNAVVKRPVEPAVEIEQKIIATPVQPPEVVVVEAPKIEAPAPKIITDFYNEPTEVIRTDEASKTVENSKLIEGTQPPIRIYTVSEDTSLEAIPEEYSQHSEQKHIDNRLNFSKTKELVSLFKRPDFKISKVENNKSSRSFEVKAPKFGRVEFAAFERKNIIRIGGIVLGCCALVVLFLSSDMISKLMSSVPKDVIGFKTVELKTNKFTNRLEPEIELAVDTKDKSTPQNENFVNVSQTAILYEENPNIPQKGEAFKGQILWTAEQETTANGKIEKFIRGQIDIPARKMKMTLNLRRNFDTSIPATHTIELLFELAPDFIQKGISSVPGILVKPAEQAKGSPLIGASARITSNYFLIALSNQAGDKERNIASLKEKSWLEIPILYETRLRAVMVMNKGNSGEKLFQQVFDSWK